MDEDDSQDELINPSRSQSKGKRAAVWAISDDSDELEEESEEGESDSGEEDEEDQISGEEEEEDEDEEDEEEEIKPEGGAPSGTSADFAEMSSDEDAEKCPICLNSFTSQPVATPENCEHYFCFDCILEWAKNSNSCPVDRLTFNNVYLRKCYGGKLKKVITVQKPKKEGQEETVELDLDQTNCEVCGGSDREDRLLLCDGCDAGYHMECLTPPLDSVPVEEWFCPECEANNRRSRNPDEDLLDFQHLASPARPATSQSQPRAAGPTRAIARTQQSERVRASVNRNRITQARSSQLAPTYLIQSSWLEDTINAVVAGLNTAVYVRDLTPRAPSGRRRKAGKRRKVRAKKTSYAKGVKGKAGCAGVKRRKRRRTKSKRKLVLKKVPTPRSRIANNLGIVKDKKGSPHPTVYRPSENTLSNMRADIGAASLSIYGDPFDLDPCDDREEVEQQARIPSLLEAKRRGISHSALRSHQPVARPFTTGLSRRHVDVDQAESVVEAAPVPDLLGSILSGQSMLLMDSSDVVINRDGTLKTAKPAIPTTTVLGSSSSRSSGEDSNPMSPGLPPNLPQSSSFLPHSGDITRSFMNGPSSQSSSGLSSSTAFTSNHPRLTPHKDFPSRTPLRPTPSSNRHQTNGASLPMPEVSTKSKTLSQSKKAPPKPTWVDVSVLPRIPKIKRENSGLTSDGSSQGSSSSHSRLDGSNSVSGGSRLGTPETGINSLSGDKGRQQSVDQPKGRTGGHTQRASSSSSSSSSFSNSFSSSTSSHASQPRYAASSSSTTAVSFRINSSGNSWQSRRLNVSPSFAGEGPLHGHLKAKEDEVKNKNRQLHRDKKMLLASRSSAGKEQNTMYDPFNPTASDSSSSDEDVDGTNLDDRAPIFTQKEKASYSKDKKAVVPSSQNLQQVKTETEDVAISPEETSRTQKAKPLEVGCSQDKIKKESTIIDPKFEKQALVFHVKVKKEQQLDKAEDSDNSADIQLNTVRASADHRLVQTTRLDVKKERNEKSSAVSSKRVSNDEDDEKPSSSVTTKKKLKEEKTSDSPRHPKSLQKDAVQNKKTSKPLNKHHFSSSETERGRREDHCGRGDKLREKDTERGSRRSSSRERMNVRSSEKSQPDSPDRIRQKRRRSRSSSKDKSRRSQSRSVSSSSSTERLRRKKHIQRNREGDDAKERRTKEKRRGRHRSKSQSRSRSRSRSNSRSRDRKRASSRSKSRSRSRERRKDYIRTPHSGPIRANVESRSKDSRRHRSRSNSRERRKGEGSSNIPQKTSGCSASSSKNAKHFQEKRKNNVIPPVSSNREERVSKVGQLEPRSSAPTIGVKLEEKNRETTSKASAVEKKKEKQTSKEIKKERRRGFDMFEDSPNIQSLKREQLNTPLNESVDHEVIPPIKSESWDLIRDKSEPDTKEVCHSPPVTSVSPPNVPFKADCHQNTVAEPIPVSSIKQEDGADSQQTSDSDDDFNVETVVDNLSTVKSEPEKDGAPSFKEEKEVVEEEKKEERLTSAAAKAKTQVKRVTWNIQEPEGPQPEKSASKVALYKMKLKQEGIRRPAIQTSSQDSSGNRLDSNKKGGDGTLPAPSICDSLQPEEFSAAGQGESAEGGDLSRKDKYLKKLHMQERAVEEVKLAIKPYYQKRDINKEEYKEILRKAVQKVCHSKSGEINPVKVGNLVKAYVDKYKHARKQKKGEDSEKAAEVPCDSILICDSP